MSFFKKLFNRIIGKTEDAPTAAAPEALPSVEADAPAVVETVAAVEPEAAPEQPPPRISAKAPPKSSPKTAAKVPAKNKDKVSVKPAAKISVAKKPAPPPPKAPPAPKSKPAPRPVDAPKSVARQKPSTAKPAARLVPAPKPQPKPEPEPTPDIVVAGTEQPLLPPAVVALPVAKAAPEVRSGWFSKLKEGLSKSSKSIGGSITAIFTKRKLDAATLQDLEDTLIQADLGVAVAERIIKAVATGRYDKEIDPEEVKRILAEEVAKVLKPVETPFNFGHEKPFVILVVGVNGSGKTTTIGKLGAIAAGEGFKVKFAACDTFRAAAIEQLTIWGKRIGAETIARPQGSDAAGLAFDAMSAAAADGTDIIFIDTAGRLHNKTYLMDELDKVVRVIKKHDAAAPHAVLLVLDATTGQNALAQAEAFTKVAGVTGLIMTKLDGTARGGILVAIAEKFKLPIHAIGVGESVDDLQPFDADAFARAIAGREQNRDAQE